MTSYNEKAICLEDPTIVNIYVPQIRAHKNVKQILTNMKGKVDSNTIIIENFKTPLSSLDHLDKKSIRTLNLNYMLDQMDPTDIDRTFHQRKLLPAKLLSIVKKKKIHKTFSDNRKL